ncbi:MAG: DUF393 domain-containing protein [Gammaproteobacteria bacterium]|nr:DUF393 domain-containing protein [Gammaproteobacteria bacterium]
MQQQIAHVDTVKPTVFYDGSCPLCSREIRHYRRLRGAEQLLWIDVSEPEATLAYGLTKDAAMARFHVLDASGEWQTGAYGFAELWSQLPAYRWLAVLVKKLRLLPLLDKAYTRFARWRLKRDCTSGSCGVDE